MDFASTLPLFFSSSFCFFFFLCFRPFFFFGSFIILGSRSFAPALPPSPFPQTLLHVLTCARVACGPSHAAKAAVGEVEGEAMRLRHDARSSSSSSLFLPCFSCCAVPTTISLWPAYFVHEPDSGVTLSASFVHCCGLNISLRLPPRSSRRPVSSRSLSLSLSLRHTYTTHGSSLVFPRSPHPHPGVHAMRAG